LKDIHGQDIINPTYNATMLAAAMAKQEGFRYLPDESIYWKQGNSSEKDFIFTTTQFITTEILDKLSEEIPPNESLLICCKGFMKECRNKYGNITIKKIPLMLSGRCEFGKDDYSLNIINLPNLSESKLSESGLPRLDDEQDFVIEEIVEKTTKKSKPIDDQQITLF
jgi:adenine-specific DNA-methyltransferase